MLRLLKRKPKPAPGQQPGAVAGRGLYLVNIKAGRGSNGTLPSTLAGVYVSVYATAADDQAAVRLAQAKLAAKGFEFLAVQGPVGRLDLRDWSRHVAQSWPEFIDELPRQEELVVGLAEDRVYLGPFVGYERGPGC